MLASGYTGPAEIAGTIAKLFPSNRNEVYILDVSAGTGLCADKVYSQGFLKIDALEPSNEMLDEARKKGIYSRYFVDGLGENTLDIANGGYIINATLHSLFPADGDATAALFRENIKTLESEGKWNQVEFRRLSQAVLGEDGALSVHKVL
ncbi:uncharacterized protein LOC124283642 [Haliotis rubra]|uniref:uncharacterized protein LOC124283642 n=1 Tax=Haliotis rubra TaxID=36100 RepID=UPI001EE4EE51|nr:uncharacterized protein LOC124283642 [Haliotis rubra]